MATLAPKTMLWSLWMLAAAFVTSLGAATTESGIIEIARCRSRCLSKFPTRKDGNEECSRVTCKECWNVCYHLVSSYEIWSTTCDNRQFCKRGCQYACDFKQSLVDKASRYAWRFNEVPSVLPEQDARRAFIAWHAPVRTDGRDNKSHTNFVYILLAKSSKPEDPWIEIEQTSSTEAIVELVMLPYRPQFWLLAVLESGTVANQKFSPRDNIHMPFDEKTIEVSGVNSLSKGVEVIYISDSTLNFTFNIRVEDGRLKPRLSWHHPDVLPAKGRRLEYQVYLFINDCGDCDGPEYFPSIVVVKDNEEPYLEFEKIQYLAEYHVDVKLLHHDEWHGEMTFFTPKCAEPNPRDLTQCITEMNLDTPRVITTLRPPLPRTSKEFIHNSSVNVLASDEKDTDHIDCHPMDFNLTEIDKQFDETRDIVRVKLDWTLPFSRSKVNKTELQYANLNHDNNVDGQNKIEVDSPPHTFEFKPNNIYTVTMWVTPKSSDGTVAPICSHALSVNTTGTEYMLLFVEAAKQPAYQHDVLNGIFVGVSSVSFLLLVSIILVRIYKKRQKRFQESMIAKTAVAKSNSYKSNVGCKVDYSNQMVVTGSDDWEVDCHQLKFSSHIGQGAFGKVVTGYYEDKRVAIKLVRDCAPISYKEDLLAEISLMKRIGSHPNIVTMIGACTLVEPICLVMEYIPYGNLQNFLKKCRLEGELCVEAGKVAEINYSILDEHGGINEGIVKPADLLSFARQVAMAMEYLAEKRYVHRDLAARNVLLGYDRIIKVCDFGLSRDIFNDNQYKKLTNGKLPLKWMAIESLRDRVFTTQSDVWSFGILLWEIVTMGASPYPTIALADLYYLLSNNYRMEKPSNCSDELYVLMRECWLEEPADRPTFTDIRVQLEVLLTRDRNYLELDNINVPLSTPESSSASPVTDDKKSLLTSFQAPGKTSRDDVTVNVSIHDKNVERFLKRKSEMDTHSITIL